MRSRLSAVCRQLSPTRKHIHEHIYYDETHDNSSGALITTTTFGHSSQEERPEAHQIVYEEHTRGRDHKSNGSNHLAGSPDARADTIYSSIADCREVLRLASWSFSRARGCSNRLVSCGVPSHVAGPSSCADGGGTTGSCSCCEAAGICAAGICAAGICAAGICVAALGGEVGVIWAANSRRAGGDHI